MYGRRRMQDRLGGRYFDLVVILFPATIAVDTTDRDLHDFEEHIGVVHYSRKER